MKTLFILDTFTGEVLSQITVSKESKIPLSLQCEFKTLKNKLGTVVLKQWIEGDEKATVILR